MTLLHRLASALRWVFRRGRVEQDLNDELQAFVDMAVADKIRDGASPAEARRVAMVDLGGFEPVKERVRTVRHGAWLDAVGRDVRYGLRHLRRNAAFSIFAVLVLAIGIGANTAVFTVINAVLFRPLAFHDPERIVALASTWPAQGTRTPDVSLPDFMDWQARAGSNLFTATAYYRKSRRAVLVDGAGSYAQTTRTSPGFFKLLGIAPVMGRTFMPDEDAGARSVVISHDFWRTQMNQSPGVLGKTLFMNDQNMKIIGVMPQGFSYPDESDLWYLTDAVNKEYEEPRGTISWFVLARLKDGVTPEQAQAQLMPIAERLDRQYPATNAGRRVEVSRLLEHMTGDARPMLFVLLGAVGVVLVISCANVATVLLAKATSRTGEVAVRTALGAGRTRIVSQLLTENLVLALLAGGLGALMGAAAMPALLALAPRDLPRLAEVGVDGRVFVFTLAVSALTTLLFGLAPTLQTSRTALNETLQRGASRAGVSGGTARVSRLLVVSEVALSVILVTAAGLLIRSFVALNTVELGFDPERVLVMDISVPGQPQRAVVFYRELLADVRSTPGVLAAGASFGTPGNPESGGSYWIDHVPDQAKIDPLAAVYSVMTPGTLSALGIPITRGRDFNDHDTADGPKTALINEALARQEFGTQDPIGRTIIAGYDMEGPMTIVGVVGNVRQRGPARPPIPEVIMPYEQHLSMTGTALHVVIKTSGPPEGLENAVRAKVRERATTVPMRFTTMEQSLVEHSAAPRFRTVLVSGFGLIALGLAVAGVYGVLTYTVGQRTREIGLRMALGATRGSISWMVMRDGAVLVVVGMMIGVLGSIAIARLISTMLFQVEPYDPMIYVGGLLFLGVIALLACYVPAARAARIDPFGALRVE